MEASAHVLLILLEAMKPFDAVCLSLQPGVAHHPVFTDFLTELPAEGRGGGTPPPDARCCEGPHVYTCMTHTHTHMHIHV